ncbi:MAG TPA: helix-turn-helix domain-containing protein, partial [Candidatus Blautia avicola]|nr:helix-turn-helix domain-containing protein [Candidatus Blautia avicola]
GSVKKVVDEDLKQQIGLKLLEEIPNFPLEEAKKEAAKE